MGYKIAPSTAPLDTLGAHLHFHILLSGWRVKKNKSADHWKGYLRCGFKTCLKPIVNGITSAKKNIGESLLPSSPIL